MINKNGFLWIGLICLGASFLVSGVAELILAIAAVILVGLSFFFGFTIEIEFPRKKKQEGNNDSDVSGTS